MILGGVRDGVDATIFLNVVGPSGLSEVIEATIDTGFSGSLTLPRANIVRLGLVLKDSQTVQLADGEFVELDLYSVGVH